MLPRIEDYRLTHARPFHAGVVEHRNTAPLGMDMHQAFELGVLLAGEEERHFQDLVLTLKPGEMWLCAAWEPHGWRPTTDTSQELVLQFLPDFLGEEVFDGVSWLTLFSAPAEQRPRVASEENRRQALVVAAELRREMHERRRGWLAAVRLGILRLLLMLSREWEPAAQPGRAGTVRTANLGKIMPAVRLVHSGPTRRLSLKEAAAACGLSVSQFGYLFRRLMGLSFGKFCVRARLGYVAQLLLTTDLPVEAIADAARFSDASHLHHSFVHVYGSTPARYRANGRAAPTGRVSTELEETGRVSAELEEAGRVYAELEEVSVEDYEPPSSP